MYDINASTWNDVAINKSITGTKTLVLICSDSEHADQFIEVLKSNPYTIKTGITTKQSYKVGIFLLGKFMGVELLSNHPQYNNLKPLLNGNISLLATAYRKDDKSLSLSSPIKILSQNLN